MTWVLSAAAQAASDSVSGIPYDGGPPWDPAACVTHWTTQAQALASAIRSAFSWVRTIGGIRCSANTANRNTVSIHGLGRALDVMMPAGQIGGPDGLALANWAVINAEAFGIQNVIWDHMYWQANLPRAQRFTPYGGPNPHTDHVHLEVTEAGGTGATPTPGVTGSITPAGSGSTDLLVLAAMAALGVYIARRQRRR